MDRAKENANVMKFTTDKVVNKETQGEKLGNLEINYELIKRTSKSGNEYVAVLNKEGQNQFPLFRTKKDNGWFVGNVSVFVKDTGEVSIFLPKKEEEAEAKEADTVL